jgi:hypothetical protein
MILYNFPTVKLQEIKEVNTFYYLASPYSIYPEGREQAFKEALAYTNILLRAGIPVFSPIVHSHPLATLSNAPDCNDYDVWLGLDKAILRGANGMLIVPMIGWRLSKGIAMEIEEANRVRIPISILNAHY